MQVLKRMRMRGGRVKGVHAYIQKDGEGMRGGGGERIPGII